jgi:chromosome segregation ATPase
MHWWVITVVCICGALMIQYLCSSKILRMKQAISIKNMALRDVRAEGSRLDEQEKDLKTQQQSLTQGIKRLRSDLKGLMPRLKEKGLEIPNPDFPLAELEDEPASAD